jgi:hypothetical protein
MSPKISSRKGAKGAKFEEIKVGAAKKKRLGEGPLRTWRLSGRKHPKFSSRKGAKGAKFGERIRSHLVQSQK